MNTIIVQRGYAQPEGADTIRFERTLPGPVERCWRWIAESELRAKWMAAGEMPPHEGGVFELVWRNDALTIPSGARPAGFGEEHRMTSRIVAWQPPRLLIFTWGETGEVEIALEPEGEQVKLRLVHRRLSADRSARLNVNAGWHAHLDLLVHRAAGTTPVPHWDHWSALRRDYEARIDAAS